MEAKEPATTATEGELDEALARAIRQLISEAVNAGQPEITRPAA